MNIVKYVFNPVILPIAFLGEPFFPNLDLDSTTTPLNVQLFGNLLKQSGYDPDETNFLIDGFTTGFDIGYEGPTNRQSVSDNIPITIGSEVELW